MTFRKARHFFRYLIHLKFILHYRALTMQFPSFLRSVQLKLIAGGTSARCKSRLFSNVTFLTTMLIQRCSFRPWIPLGALKDFKDAARYFALIQVNLSFARNFVRIELVDRCPGRITCSVYILPLSAEGVNSQIEQKIRFVLYLRRRESYIVNPQLRRRAKKCG